MFLNIDVPYIHPRRPRGGPVESGKTIPTEIIIYRAAFAIFLCLLFICYFIINTYHTLDEKIHKNSQSRGLNWPEVS